MRMRRVLRLGCVIEFVRSDPGLCWWQHLVCLGLVAVLELLYVRAWIARRAQ